MRPFSEFDAALPADLVRQAGADRLRSLATWAYLLLRPGMEFVRQRSNFILGWQAAAAAQGRRWLRGPRPERSAAAASRRWPRG